MKWSLFTLIIIQNAALLLKSDGTENYLVFEIVNLNLQNIRSILPKSCGVASLMTIFSPNTKSTGHGVTWQIIQVTVMDFKFSRRALNIIL
jgi:hypothetical protein